MDARVLVVVNCLGRTKLITVNGLSLIEEIFSKIFEICVDFNISKFRLRCVVGDVSNITIDSQYDLGNLILMCNVMGDRIVHGKVLPVEEVNGVSQPSITAGSVGDCVSSDGGTIDCAAVGNGSRDEMPNLVSTVGVVNRTNPLLSDELGNILMCDVGTKYPDNVVDFRRVLIKYCSEIGVRINYVRNTPKFIHVICLYNFEVGCSWFIKAKYVEDQNCFLVCSAITEHCCRCQNFPKASSYMLNPRFIAELLIPNVQNKLNLSAKDVVDAMKIGYGFAIPYWKANRAAVIARWLIYGNHLDSHDKMYYYCKALEVTNLGSSVVFEVEPISNMFKRVFVCLSASIEGFRCCLPMLFVDGTFLRGRAKGALLVAIGKDGNRGLFPFAFALVSAETTYNWSWFLNKVKGCVQHDSKLYYLFERNAGLLAAFPLVFQESVHFFCLFHLIANLKTRFSGGLEKKNRARYHRLFKECAYELDVEVFISKIKQFTELGGKKVVEFLSQLPFEKWAIAFAPIMSRFGEMTSNAAESFNSWIIVARSLPITKIFDFIRLCICRWFVERSSASKLWGSILVPRKQEEWNQMAVMSQKWNVLPCPGGAFEVQANQSVSVDLFRRVCSCKLWQSLGFPCAHVLAVICIERCSVVNDVDSYFLAATYRICSSGVINPVCETVFNEMQKNSSFPRIVSPVLPKPAGRPKSKKRNLSYIEKVKCKVKMVKCPKCGFDDNHDVWTCSNIKALIDLNQPAVVVDD